MAKSTISGQLKMRRSSKCRLLGSMWWGPWMRMLLRHEAEGPIVQQLKTVFHTLKHGQPMEAFPQSKELFDELGVPGMGESRWNGKAGWDMSSPCTQ